MKKNLIVTALALGTLVGAARVALTQQKTRYILVPGARECAAASEANTRNCKDVSGPVMLVLKPDGSVSWK